MQDRFRITIKLFFHPNAIFILRIISSSVNFTARSILFRRKRKYSDTRNTVAASKHYTKKASVVRALSGGII